MCLAMVLMCSAMTMYANDVEKDIMGQLAAKSAAGESLTASELTFIADYERNSVNLDEDQPIECYCPCPNPLDESGTINLNIPDYDNNNGPVCTLQSSYVSHTIHIAGQRGNVMDVNVKVNITHTYVGDLVVFLVHDGDTVKLKTRVASGYGESCDNIYLFFDDEGSPWGSADNSGNCDRSNCVRPTHPSGNCSGYLALSHFDGMPAAGDWTLLVSDNAAGDLGRLNYWGLCLTTDGIPYTEVDLGDLDQCNYPTLPNNPAHGLSGVAWLGQHISGETTPNSPDTYDDGVWYNNRPWTPCTMQSVTVSIHAGINYNNYCQHGGHLYLNGWKDGNLDGDFCDVLCDGRAPEWIVQDLLVTPGTRTIQVMDPGVFDHGIYDGVFRWRLTSRPVGPEGFGMADRQACPNSYCGTYAIDPIGEVEDYRENDLQLDVELASFTAEPVADGIQLTWRTASESNNSYFVVTRDNELISTINSNGNTATGYTYSYVDRNCEVSENYTYTLAAVDAANGRRELGSRIASYYGAAPSMVSAYALYQNYPNPFNPTTSISFDLLDGGTVTLKIYNPMGQLVSVLANGYMARGSHTVNFDASSLPSGLYLYRLEANTFTATKKMLLVK